MPTQPSADEIAKWDRWFAVEASNQAWDFVETMDLSADQRQTMLNAAHAAALHWGRVGTDLNRARADMLLAQVHATLGNGKLAMEYGRRSFDFFSFRECPDWEIAFAHAVLANAAYADHDLSLHGTAYALAKQFGDSIVDDGDKDVFNRMFSRLPKPL